MNFKLVCSGSPVRVPDGWILITVEKFTHFSPNRWKNWWTSKNSEKIDFGKTWRYGASIPGPFECKSNALPLSYTPVPLKAKETKVFAQVVAIVTLVWYYACGFANYSIRNALYIRKHKYQRILCPQSVFLENSKTCPDPGLNQGPSDLQSDALPTELSGLCIFFSLSCSHSAVDLLNNYAHKWNPNFVKNHANRTP